MILPIAYDWYRRIIIIIIIILLLGSFSDQRSMVDFLSTLSDSKTHQVTRTPLSILADLNNAVVMMVSIFLLYFHVVVGGVPIAWWLKYWTAALR